MSLVMIPSLCLCDDAVLKSGESNAKAYTLEKFNKEINPSPVDGVLVRLKFESRSEYLRDYDGGFKSSRIHSLNYSGVDVLLPKEGLTWFKKIPIDIDWNIPNPKQYTVYGRVRINSDGSPVVQLVGNEIKHDLKGDSIFWR